MNKLKLFLLVLIMAGFSLTACSTNRSTSEAKPLKTDTPARTATLNPPQQETSVSKNNPNTNDIAQKTREYILKGQENKPEAEKVKWSGTFLNQVNIDAVYQAYLSAGGASGDIQSFALYLTLNAPVPENWQALAAADLLNTYDEKASKFEPRQDSLYQVYVKKDGKDVPFVVVNSRTGYFHG